MKLNHHRRGTALIQVLVLTLIAMGVLAVVLGSVNIAHSQTKGNTENTMARSEARGAVHASAAYLSRDLIKGTPITPTDFPALWAGDGAANPYYLVIVGRGAQVTIDTTGTFYASGGPGNVVDFDGGGAGSARDLLVNPTGADFGLGGDPEFAARVEYKVLSGTDFYYEITTLALASDANSRGLTPTVLSMKAALVPEAPEPWEFGMAGLNQVTINGAGNFGMIDTDGKTNTVIATNGTVSKN